MGAERPKRYRSLRSATANGSAIECLRCLAYKQATAIDEQVRDGRLKAVMAAEYRATILEVARLEGAASDDAINRMVEAHRSPGSDLPSLSVV